MIGLATELLDLVARWVHVIAGIMWVGNSLLFNWLDRNLVSHPDQTPPALRTGAKQSIWLLHSGGFYFVEKTLLPGQKLPAPLHWFKWQAYTTWLTGVALLFIVYWAGGRAVMGIGLSRPFAAVLGILAIATASLVYEASNRLIAPHAPRLAFAVWTGVVATISYWLVEFFDGRAAFLHVGAMLGTIMAGNVFFTIVPSQRKLVTSVDEGRQMIAAVDSARAKRVSIHNNYITFPVIVLMLSAHFPALYGGANAFAKLVVLIIGGAAVRHVLNVRYTMRTWVLRLAVVALVTVGLLFTFSMRPAARSPVVESSPVAFADVQRVIDRRCAVCHSTEPADLTFGAAPAGVAFDTPAEITAHASRIHQRAVVTRSMPPTNRTNITEAERELIARWFAQGARR